MRIDAINMVSQIYKPARPKKVNEAGGAKFEDKYEVSKSGQDYQMAKSAVKSSPDIREGKVSDIKNALAAGTYNVSAQEIADKMVSRYFDSII